MNDLFLVIDLFGLAIWAAMYSKTETLGSSIIGLIAIILLSCATVNSVHNIIDESIINATYSIQGGPNV